MPDDLAPFAEISEAKAQAMIEDAVADASRVAPCINDEGLSLAKVAQFKSILRGAILRWNEAGTGALQAQQAGPFGQTIDTRQQRRGMFWPSELTALASICSQSGSVYTVSLAGPDPVPADSIPLA